MSFDATVDGHHLTIDAHTEHGGQDLGPSPKRLLLVALAGCTAMDVTSLLNKMRVPFTDLQVDTSGEVTEEHPKIYGKMHITYRVAGAKGFEDKMEKAVNLSLERYCGVTAMLSKAGTITHEILYV